MTELSLLAPCKVNLTLDVGARRSDGFHDLDSVVLPFYPADEVRAALHTDGDGVRFHCSDPNLPQDSTNLAYRAAIAFRESFPFPGGIEIELTKHLPAQAGLGGGSSDAAAVLCALQKLTRSFATVSNDVLHAIAATIGSDVPLFLHCLPVRMQGRGEKITPIQEKLPDLHGVLVRPEVGVPTVAAYNLLDALPNRLPGCATTHLLETLKTDLRLETLATSFSNDFEAPILYNFPAIQAAYDAVRATGALRSLLCGSGSAVFGLAADVEHARALTEQLSPQFPWVTQAKRFYL